MKTLKCASPQVQMPLLLSAAMDTLQPLTVEFSRVIGSLDTNKLCGLDRFGHGTYTAAGVIKIAEMLKVNKTLKSIRCAPFAMCSPLLSAAMDTF